MKRSASFTIALLISLVSVAQETLEYFLPGNVSYAKQIPSPLQFTGYEPGEWHLTHDKIVSYMVQLAEKSNRAIWEEYGRSYENRPLGQLIISSPENIRDIEKLRQQHNQLCDPRVSDKAEIAKMPLFIKLGYGIHGNESSGQNASALVAYYLVAGEGNKIEELLRNTVILIDPALNPDGMQRHSTWVNSARSLNNNPDVNSWEFSEPWPGGRSNHYWFDLNRDYLMLQQPESAGRVEAFFRWRPNIITDHHEMSANSTFFFQPGVKSRNNTLTPDENMELTAEIGRYHEKYLNALGSLYYTEETYDDFYLGKGSSYPDIHGSVGILFEQAGVKGHLRETPSGLLTFPFAIRNQVAVSLSTLEAGLNLKTKLLESQRNFYKDAAVQADKHLVKAYIFTEPDDKRRVSEFIKTIQLHNIRVYKLARDINKNGVDFKAANSYIIPLKQNEYRFIRSLFEPVKDFADSIFYDISTWVLPMSFNIQYEGINSIKDAEGLTGVELLIPPTDEGRLIASKDSYAYLFEWNEYLTPRALYQLQDAGITTRVSAKKFRCYDEQLNKDFSIGTIMINAKGQKLTGNDLFNLLETVAKDCGITIYGVSTGLTPEGIDLGSSGFSVLKKPSVLMITGDGINSADAGEIWHMFDTRFRIPVTMVNCSRMGAVNLDRYNVLIVAGQPEISSAAIGNIKVWNDKGGTVIGYKSGNNWLAKNKFAAIRFVPPVASSVSEGAYANRSGDNQVQVIPGSIFETKLDLTHPLCYGFTRDLLPVFKNSNSVSVRDSDIYNNPVIYTLQPLLSGYCTKENLERIKGSPFASVHGNRIISIYDNTNFRAIWYGTGKIFMNAVFFGQLLGKGNQGD